MAYRIAGTYIGHCNCQEVCGCPFNERPTAPDGLCFGVAVFSIREGHLDGLDLSGVNVGLSYFVPETFGAGNFRQGLVIDDRASDEQADAVERIFSGKEGGPWEMLAALVGEYVGAERGSVRFSDEDSPSATVGDRAITIELYRGHDGNPSTISNAPLGLAPVYRIGRSSGRGGLFGDDFEAVYAETADFEYSG